jgi:hypothetical protein
MPLEHSSPAAGSSGGQYWRPQFQPLAVQLQLAASTVHDMPVVGQADISAGSEVGQSAGDQHAQVFMPWTQSQVWSAYLQVPIAGVHDAVADGFPAGQVCTPLFAIRPPVPAEPPLRPPRPPFPAVLPDPERPAVAPDPDPPASG